MLCHNSGRGRGAGGGRGGLQSPRAPQTPFWECSQDTCRMQGFCEFKLMKQEYSDLLNDRYRRVGGYLPNGQYEFNPKYPRFRYKYSEPVVYEFYRMCRAFGWKRPPPNSKEPPNPEFIKARERFRDALTLQFNALYGTEEDNLTSWRNLCCVLNLANVPEELEACRNLVASMHVNIIDLIDTPVTQDPIVHFKSEEHLSIYTRHTGKKFPRDNVHSGDLLRFLLRKIDSYASHPLDWGQVLSDSSSKH